MVTDTTQSPPVRWNAGAWFGVQLGSTLWLAISATVLAVRSVTVAGIVCGLFLLANVIGILLWRRRSQMAILVAMQILLAALWACSMTAIFVIDRAGLWETLAVGGRNNTPASRTYVMLTVLVLALGLMFQLRHRKQSGSSRGGV